MDVAEQESEVRKYCGEDNDAWRMMGYRPQENVIDSIFDEEIWKEIFTEMMSKVPGGSAEPEKRVRNFTIFARSSGVAGYAMDSIRELATEYLLSEERVRTIISSVKDELKEFCRKNRALFEGAAIVF